MDSGAFDKLLQSLNVGKKFIGSGNILFDRSYEVTSNKMFKEANLFAKQQLAFYFDRQTFYDSSDCDTFHLMWLGRIREFLLKHDPLAKSAPTIGMVWGLYEDKPHAWGIHVGREGLTHCNYCRITIPSSFIIKGSVYV
jgi:hypothetical protein